MISIIVWIIFGAIVGIVAKAINPGNENLNFAQTVILGILGSFAGGAISYFLGWSNYLLGSSGFLMSVVGAVLLCWLWAYIKRNGN